MSEGLDLITAMMIQGNEIYVDVYSNKEKTGYGFMVYLMKEGQIHTLLVSTEPVFEAKRRARREGMNFVEAVKKMDLTPQQSKLEKIIGPEESKLVSEVVKLANNPSI